MSSLERSGVVQGKDYNIFRIWDSRLKCMTDELYMKST